MRFLEEYEPQIGDRFIILNAFGGVQGRFDTVKAPTLPKGMALEVEYGEDQVELVISERPFGLQRLGDSNQDGGLDISDPLSLLFHLFTGSPELPCEGGTIFHSGNRTLLDSNGSGEVDLSDALHVLFFLFNGGPPPAGDEGACVEIEWCPEACPG